MNRRVRITLSTCACVVALLAAATSHLAAEDAPQKTSAVRSEIRKTKAGERILVNQLTVAASVEAVWDAYTTIEGWTAWASPQAKIDLRVGGEILTRYDTTGKIGEPGTNRLTIVNYVPHAVLTLKADLSANWPEVMKADADNLSNVILFRRVGEQKTEITSYGIGYRDVKAYDAVLAFFARANVKVLEGLRAYVERGKRAYQKK